MRWIVDKSGRFPKRLFFETIAEIDDECERLVEFVHYRRRKAKFAPPLDDDTLQVLIEEHADVDLYATLDPGVEAETEFRPDARPMIRLSAEIASDPRRRNRQRTGLAHEWFHAAYHRPAWEILWGRQRRSGADASAQIGKCRRETILGAPDRDWTEFQAGYASCAILMPKSWVDKDASEFCTLGGKVDEQAMIDAVSVKYEVSEEAARWRLRQLGVLRRVREAAVR